MRKLSAPVLIDKIDLSNAAEWIKRLKECKLDRVFLCGLCEFYSSEEKIERHLKKCAELKPLIEEAGMEFAIWINGFGHGMLDVIFGDKKGNYQKFVGEDGTSTEDCFCPRKTT